MTHVLLIIHVIRTNGFSFLQSWPSRPVVITSLVILAIGLSLRYSPLASTRGFVTLPGFFGPRLLSTLFCYLLLSQPTKMWLLRRKRIAA